MSVFVRQRGNAFTLRVKHRLLDKPYNDTFDTEAEARAYGTRLEALLAQGKLPADLAPTRNAKSTPVSSLTLAQIERDYRGAVTLSAHDQSLFSHIVVRNGKTRLADLMTYKWAEDYVRGLKIERNLAPGTIRKRVGAIARLLDWYIKRTTKAGETPLANPLRLLPKNYSAYNEFEQASLKAQGKAAKRDTERDRRLDEGEEATILAALAGVKREDRERPLELPEDKALAELFALIVNTGLRLREAYRLRPEHIKLTLNTIHVAKSKTGAKRDVPIPPKNKSMLVRRVKAALAHGKRTPIFPFWAGEDDSDKELNRVTSLLSKAFARAFEYAGCENLREHDLRHEAACRWVLMTNAKGDWLYRGEEVMKITGHKDPRVFMRYLSLRGSDLAARLYA